MAEQWVGTMDREVEETARKVSASALAVHRALGPGLLESVYERCLAFELRCNGVSVKTQAPISITYRGVKMPVDLRADLIADGRVLVEVKAVESVLPVHGAQLLTYLKLSGLRLGFLITFNVPMIRDGMKRVVL